MTTRGLHKIEVTETTDEMLDLLQAVIDAGLEEAGIADVKPRT